MALVVSMKHALKETFMGFTLADDMLAPLKVLVGKTMASSEIFLKKILMGVIRSHCVGVNLPKL